MDNTTLNKITIIKNCLKRIREEYLGHEEELEYNYTKQDSIILNLQRMCESAIDLGIHIIKLKKLGVPQTSREVFSLLEKEGTLPKELSQKMQAMVGFRNIAVHDYQHINLDIVRSILETKLQDIEAFIECISS
jgi:uncharacterized protein YutE (UPF0331/DUF86 family)